MALRDAQPLLNKPLKYNPSTTRVSIRWLLQQLGIQEGVAAAGDFKVSQRGAGANLSVDVAGGSLWVVGDDTQFQGVYQLVNDAIVNKAIVGGGASPRVDRVVARNWDSTIAGGSDTPTIDVIQGSGAAGAQASNHLAANYLAGAGSVPNSALLLADIEVAAGAGSIANANIVDRRPMARGTRADSGVIAGPTYSASGGTLVSLTMECSGRQVALFVSGTAHNDGTDGTQFTHDWQFRMDDANAVGVGQSASKAQGAGGCLAGSHVYSPAAGRRKFSLFCLNGANATWGLYGFRLWAIELPNVLPS